jgi:hypothetical protein
LWNAGTDALKSSEITLKINVIIISVCLQ